jgi:hypothetical protein
MQRLCPSRYGMGIANSVKPLRAKVHFLWDATTCAWRNCAQYYIRYGIATIEIAEPYVQPRLASESNIMPKSRLMGNKIDAARRDVILEMCY